MNTKLLLALVGLSSIASGNMVAQSLAREGRTPLTLFLQGGGTSLSPISLHLDSRLGRKERAWGFSVAYGLWRSEGINKHSLPIATNYLLSLGGRGYLEGAIGPTLRVLFEQVEDRERGYEDPNQGGCVRFMHYPMKTEAEMELYGSLSLGYRYQNFGRKGLAWGFGISYSLPLVHRQYTPTPRAWQPYLRIGYAF